ncbi:hypothetical protein GGR50DRAFT_655996 [Xylaria sp. CBS 124048]|nr:hypothetical protein GGR50DRAFT_655996 [Xylaria sp. CBS 124048]
MYHPRRGIRGKSTGKESNTVRAYSGQYPVISRKCVSYLGHLDHQIQRTSGDFSLRVRLSRWHDVDHHASIPCAVDNNQHRPTPVNSVREEKKNRFFFCFFSFGNSVLFAYPLPMFISCPCSLPVLILPSSHLSMSNALHANVKRMKTTSPTLGPGHASASGEGMTALVNACLCFRGQMESRCSDIGESNPPG